jgi:hypothetical protein
MPESERATLAEAVKSRDEKRRQLQHALDNNLPGPKNREASVQHQIQQFNAMSHREDEPAGTRPAPREDGVKMISDLIEEYQKLESDIAKRLSYGGRSYGFSSIAYFAPTLPDLDSGLAGAPRTLLRAFEDADERFYANASKEATTGGVWVPPWYGPAERKTLITKATGSYGADLAAVDVKRQELSPVEKAVKAAAAKTSEAKTAFDEADGVDKRIAETKLEKDVQDKALALAKRRVEIAQGKALFGELTAAEANVLAIARNIGELDARLTTLQSIKSNITIVLDERTRALNKARAEEDEARRNFNAKKGEFDAFAAATLSNGKGTVIFEFQAPPFRPKVFEATPLNGAAGQRRMLKTAVWARIVGNNSTSGSTAPIRIGVHDGSVALTIDSLDVSQSLLPLVDETKAAARNLQVGLEILVTFDDETLDTSWNPPGPRALDDPTNTSESRKVLFRAARDVTLQFRAAMPVLAAEPKKIEAPASKPAELQINIGSVKLSLEGTPASAPAK